MAALAVVTGAGLFLWFISSAPIPQGGVEEIRGPRGASEGRFTPEAAKDRHPAPPERVSRPPLDRSKVLPLRPHAVEAPTTERDVDDVSLFGGLDHDFWGMFADHHELLGSCDVMAEYSDAFDLELVCVRGPRGPRRVLHDDRLP